MFKGYREGGEIALNVATNCSAELLKKTAGSLNYNTETFEKGMIKKGDVLQFTLDGKGEISVIRRVYTPTDAVYWSSASNLYNSDGVYVTGSVEHIDSKNNLLKICYTAAGGMRMIGTGAAKTIYIVEDGGKTVSVGSIGDLVEGDIIVSILKQERCGDIVIVRQ